MNKTKITTILTVITISLLLGACSSHKGSERDAAYRVLYATTAAVRAAHDSLFLFKTDANAPWFEENAVPFFREANRQIDLAQIALSAWVNISAFYANIRTVELMLGDRKPEKEGDYDGVTVKDLLKEVEEL